MDITSDQVEPNAVSEALTPTVGIRNCYLPREKERSGGTKTGGIDDVFVGVRGCARVLSLHHGYHGKRRSY